MLKDSDEERRATDHVLRYDSTFPWRKSRRDDDVVASGSLRELGKLLSAFNPTVRLSRRDIVRGGTAAAALYSVVQPALAAKKPRSDASYGVQKTTAEWKKDLSEYQYYILREGGTEPPGSSPLVKEKRDGVFYCSACDNKLFASTAKFESGTGWPSFGEPIGGAVEVMGNPGLFGAECRCARCGGHLGDVFGDGLLFPGTSAFATGKRFCIDGTSLEFEPSGATGSKRVSGEPKQVRSINDVELPDWLQPPKPKANQPA